jgi:hypothetical protein
VASKGLLISLLHADVVPGKFQNRVCYLVALGGPAIVKEAISTSPTTIMVPFIDSTLKRNLVKNNMTTGTKNK